MKNKLSRRSFLQNSLKAGLAVAASNTVLTAWANTPTNKKWEPDYTQQKLPYAFNALEPIIDAATMEIHYTKHAAAYAKNFNEAFKEEYKGAALPNFIELMPQINNYSAKFRNNGGGHYNHELFWKTLQPATENNLPSQKLMQAIEKHFGSFENFKTNITKQAMQRFGSGWAWLIIKKDAKELTVTSTPNQDNPLMPYAEVQGYPLLGIDVWEHAYYLKYQNKRADYIENWFKVINWNFVEDRFVNAI